MNKYEISFEELNKLESKSYVLVDIREEESWNYGVIPGSIQVNEADIFAYDFEIGKKYILYCARGVVSLRIAEELEEKGVDAFSLLGGYNGWILSKMKEDEAQKELNERINEIELSIRGKFHKELFSKFAKAIKTYELIKEGDKIAVCISGGKDSMLMAKLFMEIKRHRKIDFDLVFLCMDPGYSPANREIIENNAKIMGIPLTIFESDIFNAVFEVENSPCYLCARMRRGYLYSKAKELGCNKIALGHHYDDVIETILMGMLYSGQFQSMMPKLHSTNFEGMELIRPMYFIREEDIKRWRDYNGLYFIQCACKFTEQCDSCKEDGTSASKRLETKRLIAKLKKDNPFVEGNIFKASENVNLNTIIGYKKGDVKHSFLEEY